ncbi:xanthine dehydrogenase accessory protein XdhC [Halomonas shantousis]
MTWYDALARLQRDGTPHALASVVGAAGSTPREPGAKMVITEDSIFDTLGGGTFEYQVIESARHALATLTRGEDVATPQLEAFPLGGRSGQCCGGYVHVLIELFAGAEMTVAVFGAGHVGQALVGLLAPLHWRVMWFDSREEIFPAWACEQPRLTCHALSEARRTIAALPSRTHALVMTHDHAQDRELIDALLMRNDSASIGLIGSDSKWASFRSRLREAGHGAAALEKVRCPIGIPGAPGKRPYEIALAVTAELLTLKAATPGGPDQRGLSSQALRNVFPSSRQP